MRLLRDLFRGLVVEVVDRIDEGGGTVTDIAVFTVVDNVAAADDVGDDTELSLVHRFQQGDRQTFPERGQKEDVAFRHLLDRLIVFEPAGELDIRSGKLPFVFTVADPDEAGLRHRSRDLVEKVRVLLAVDQAGGEDAQLMFLLRHLFDQSVDLGGIDAVVDIGSIIGKAERFRVFAFGTGNGRAVRGAGQ